MKKGDKDFSAAVNQVKGVSPDAVFYSGYYAEAAPFVQQLRDGGFNGTFVERGRHQGPGVRQAGRRSVQGRHPVLPVRPGNRRVRHEVQGRSSVRTPGTYSLEGYDLATIMVKGIDSGKITRPDLLDWVRNYQGQGMARKYQWTETGELTDAQVWIYKVQ